VQSAGWQEAGSTALAWLPEGWKRDWTDLTLEAEPPENWKTEVP
jgi:hypothetical protein